MSKIEDWEVYVGRFSDWEDVTRGFDKKSIIMMLFEIFTFEFYSLFTLCLSDDRNIPTRVLTSIK